MGLPVGVFVDKAVGESVGDAVGPFVGDTVGLPVGAVVGALDGVAERATVGALLEEAEGDGVGPFVGDEAGLASITTSSRKTRLCLLSPLETNRILTSLASVTSMFSTIPSWYSSLVKLDTLLFDPVTAFVQVCSRA